jgi:hypothetical protein
MSLLMEFAENEENDPKQSYWRLQAKSVLCDFLTLEMEYYSATGERLLHSIAKACDIPGVLGCSYWHGLRSVLAHSCSSSRKLTQLNYHLQLFISGSGIVSPSLSVMSNFLATSDLTEQWSYTCMSMQPILTLLANPEVGAFVDMDIIANVDEPRTEIADLIEQSKVILFCPEPSLGHAFAGKAIKQRFYEAVFSREDLEKPIFVALDEYQHFVTENDTRLLDRCRAYRCVVLLASQSVASLKHALGSNNKAQNVTDIICTNTPTRFSMRCSDAETAAWLRTQIPVSPDGGPHILDVRRLANLKPGESYFVYANGDWGLKQARLSQGH